MKHKSRKPDKVSPNYDRKISEVLGEFVAEIAPEDALEKEYAQSVRIAVILWNLALLPESEQGETLWRMQEMGAGGHDPLFAARLHELFDLRCQKYGSDRRFVVDFQIESTPKGWHLLVASIDPDRGENKPAVPDSLSS